MKKIVRKSIWMAIMAAAIVFSVIQLNTTVVRAVGAQDCPPGYTVFCHNCQLSYALVWGQGNTAYTECHYECSCSSGGGGGEGFYIEQTLEVYQ